MDTEVEVEKNRGIPGSTIKMIAIIAMFIDHTAAVILERIMRQQGIKTMLDMGQVEPIEIV